MAITGILGLFAMVGSAQADTRLGTALKAFSPLENTVTKAGFFDNDDDCDNSSYRRKRCRYRASRDCDDDADRGRRHCSYKRWYHRRHHADRDDYRGKCCGRRRHVRRHRPRFPPRPIYGRNYEVYTYRRPYAVDSAYRGQMIYGWYRGYYYPYPSYPGAY